MTNDFLFLTTSIYSNGMFGEKMQTFLNKRLMMPIFDRANDNSGHSPLRATAMINPSVLFRLEILSIFVFVALSISGCDNTNADNIDIGALGDIKIPTIGSYEHCPSVSTGKGGKGGKEAYDGFAPFDSTGVGVRNCA